jgi:hypothetical protein
MSPLLVLTLLFLIVPICLLAEKQQDKERIRYEEYLTQLELVKERKRERNA